MLPFQALSTRTQVYLQRGRFLLRKHKQRFLVAENASASDFGNDDADMSVYERMQHHQQIRSRSVCYDIEIFEKDKDRCL